MSYFAYNVGGWVQKEENCAYVIYVWSLIRNHRQINRVISGQTEVEFEIAI